MRSVTLYLMNNDDATHEVCSTYIKINCESLKEVDNLGELLRISYFKLMKDLDKKIEEGHNKL